ncbi:LADA_0F14598g1_1 [Lachancea dasiensis]|uniref:Mediator of RNA polymerase II transcription subunit 12 n=1 Tax=Lachancea dasiensis TaxID=1072105 RepID=A0A1G4JN87_9SACH|nr:LADA_0F14598g1_1 [Lachancea dasiensis]
MPNKYLLNPPDNLHSLTADSRKRIYPDFDPWSHTPVQDQIFLEFVSKGYYNSAKVNFESISSRSSLQESLPAVSEHLAEQLSKVMTIREEQVNKIGTNSPDSKSMHTAGSDLCGPGFSLPKRVTLTDHKRELWLQALSSPHSSLADTVKTIPHGLKRRQVLEQCYQKQVPYSRAIWLIKCCFTLEWNTLISKQVSRQHEVSLKLLKEWSESMAHILEKLVFEMTQYYNEPLKLKSWRRRLAYYLKLLGNCYALHMIDRNVFHHWLVDFVVKVENFECLPMTLHILIVFWDGIFGSLPDSENPQQLFLVNKLTEALIYKYYMVSTSKSMINDEQYLINDIKKNKKLGSMITKRISFLILKVFDEQSLEAFVFPSSNWEIYKKCLYEIIPTEIPHENHPYKTDSLKKLELIVYRNESLKFNTILHDPEEHKSGSNNEPNSDLESIFIPNRVLKLKNIDYELTRLLDANAAGDDWLSFAEHKFSRVDQVIQMMLWAIHPSRFHHYEAAELTAKLLLLKLNLKSGLLEYSLEDKIWALMFVFAKLKPQERCLVVKLSRLHQLLNVFIGYGIVKVPTYIRKLISSGVLYLTDSDDKFFHCELLINLKISPLMKSQYNMVLRNVVDVCPKYFEDYNYDNLMALLGESKDSLLTRNYTFFGSVPYSVKLMTSEWYLNLICSPVNGDLLPVTKVDIRDKLMVFCVNLKLYHQFYKWVEFIVYHKLLKDLEALECLVDILIYYDRLFSLLINDHILLMKTILHLYSDKLIWESPESQNLITLGGFLHFFTTRFPMALELDTDLQAKLHEVNEFEKAKIEKVTKSNSRSGPSTFPNEQDLTISSGDDSSSFPSLFQLNLKLILHPKTDDELQTARNNMKALMIVNLSEYNKFMAIFLKRKVATANDLARLISIKVLSLNSVSKILGEESLLLMLDNSFYDHGMAFDLEKKHFTRRNLKTVFKALCDNLPTNYKRLLDLIAEYSPSKIVQDYAYKVIGSSEILGHKCLFSLASEMLSLGVVSTSSEYLLFEPNKDEREEDDGDMTEDEADVLDLYERLDFTNLWIFQLLTCHFLQKSETNNSAGYEQRCSRLVLDCIRISNNDILGSKLFDKVTDIEVLQNTLQVLEVSFLKNLLGHQIEGVSQYPLIVETIINISRKLNRVLAGNIALSKETSSLMQKCCQRFAMNDSEDLKALEPQLDVFLKILIVHQRFILKEGFENSTVLQKNDGNFLKLLCLLFQKIGFSLKLKLLLYDVLASLKSFALFSPSNGEQLLFRSARVKIPQELVDLPPFKISSFMTDTIKDDSKNIVELGIKDKEEVCHNYEPKFFFYNRKLERFEAELTLRPYHLLDNLQEDNEFNDTPLNLSLFNARFDRQNPT